MHLAIRKVFFVKREERTMKTKNIPRQKTVFAITPDEWDERVNAVLANLPDYKELDIHREKTADGFLAIVQYTVSERIPEDIREEMEMQGIRHKCGDCPHLMRVSDKRVKHLHCDLGMRELTQADMRACMWRYEQDMGVD